ncbi:FecR domain-containing protein [Caballeronia humi]|uniref:FecR protein n=1 Tax=Caballeronia humi TaxID=326474 RepID=A0A158G800_9BURK|nr:FecR domain-containing protein [Caballeronia humi]SAL28244.1 FecR protein [Caballeronia humi]
MTRLMARINAMPAMMVGLMMAAPLAQASVEGVTLSFSPGNGLKPRVEVKRGVVAAGQRYATGASEIREVLFPDGTSVTLAPNTELEIDAFDYPDTGSGQLALRLGKGLVRIAGGRFSEAKPIVVRTTAGEVRLDAASAVVEVTAEGRTRASLLVGRDVEMVSGGQTQRIERPGFELVSLTGQAPPAGPSREAEGVAAADAFDLGTAQLSGLTKDEEDQLGRAGLSQIAAAGAATLALATEDKPSGSLSIETPPPAPPAPPAPPTGGFVEIGSTAGGKGSEGFGPGKFLVAGYRPDDQPSESNGDLRSLAQSRGNATVNGGTFDEPVRGRVPTTNRLFISSEPYTQSIGMPTLVSDKFDGALLALTPPDAQLQYIFRQENNPGPGDQGFPGIQLDGINQRLGFGTDHVLSGFNFDTSPPFLFNKGIIPWPQPGVLGVSYDVAETVATVLNPTRPGSGSIFGTASHWEILQAGFKMDTRKTAPSAPDDPLGKVEAETMIRAADNFLLVEVRPGRLNSANAPELDPARGERFLFATGNVDAGRLIPSTEQNPGEVNYAFKPTFAVDRFFLSAGLENFDQKKDPGRTVASNIRAFLRQPTAVGQTLSDTGFYVVNAGPGSPQARNSVLHADFGQQGDRGNQQSTISVTVGDVKYELRHCDSCAAAAVPGQSVMANSVIASISGRTIGSSRGNVRPGQFGTVAISSPLMSTAFGGGNPAMPNRDGYAGYFILENYTPPTDQDVTNHLNGGSEHALGSNTTDDVQYAVLRLATATGQVPVNTRSGAILTGWAGGLAEKENGPGAALTINPIGSGTSPNNFVIQTDASDNRLQVDLLLSGHAPMTLGGPNNPSAMIDDNRFAAANGSVAMVNANLLRDGAGNLPASLNLPNGHPIPNYQYLQWGFLLGDTAGTAGVDLEHLHMGTWIAGRAADQLPTTGSATYSGHAIGNVASGGALYTAVGSYDNTWNFAQRNGTVNMNFDGAQYNGTTQLTSGANFQGTMSAASRAAGVIGNFVQAPGGTPAGVPPPAVAGRFVIQETAGNPYRASGTFGAERR